MYKNYLVNKCKKNLPNMKLSKKFKYYCKFQLNPLNYSLFNEQMQGKLT